MSADPRRSSAALVENTTGTEAVLLAGCVMAGLIALVILKFFVNICIDVVCLGDLASARRSIRGLARKFCPCWHPRTQPEAPATETHDSMIEIQAVLRGRPLEERKDIVATILSDKILSKADLKILRGNVSETTSATDADEAAPDEDEVSSSGRCVCSICLVDFEINDHIVTATQCQHTYHQACIVEWLGSHGTDCPYCRREMISLKALEEAAHVYSA